ncbi:MAG: hypothetical protein JSU09_17025 [Bacteroidetes bacterium]|nr:hypothetical protein [Bacteroidota bacterium]
MRQILIGLLFLGTTSCSIEKKNSTDFNFNADSVFVESFSTKGLTKIKGTENFKVKEDQSFFKQELNLFSFYVFKTQKLSDTIDIKIILAKPNYPIVFDGELKIVYLMTIGKSGKQLDIIRVGKTESAAEYNVTETSIIENGLVKRKSDESTYEEDSTGGRRVHKLKNDLFKITSDGKIKRQPTRTSN